MAQNTNELPPILIERGKYMTHCGYAGDDKTELSFRTPKTSDEEQFSHIFDEILKVDPSQYRVVLIKDTGTPQEVLRKEANILFTKFNVQACAFCNAQRGVIYSVGIKGGAGLILDMGYESTIIAPIIGVMTKMDHYTAMPFGGKTIERYIIDHLIKSGVADKIIERYKKQLFPFLMKEYYYFESESEEDFEREAIERRKEELPDFLIINNKEGEKIKLALPNPVLPASLLVEKSTEDNHSVSEEISSQISEILETYGAESFGSIYDTDYDSWWVARIIFTGGNSNVLGLRSLLIRELLKTTEIVKYTGNNRDSSNPLIDIVLKNAVYTIRNLPYKKTPYTWIGGSMEFSLRKFSKYFISRVTYQNNPDIVFPIDYERPWEKE